LLPVKVLSVSSFHFYFSSVKRNSLNNFRLDQSRLIGIATLLSFIFQLLLLSVQDNVRPKSEWHLSLYLSCSVRRKIRQGLPRRYFPANGLISLYPVLEQ